MQRTTSWTLVLLAALIVSTMASLMAGTASAARWGKNYFPNLPVLTQDGKTLRFYDDLIKGKIVIVDFWASWCGPCLQLKKVTFGNKKVARLLEQTQVVFVDLDVYPKLGRAYAVESVPDVFLIDRNGFIVDRVQNFEPPATFAKRLGRLLSDESETKHPVEPAKNR